MFVGNESAPKIIKEINHRFLFALQLTLVSNTSLAILTSVPLTHHSYHPSPAHSHFRLETFLFCKFFPPWPSFSSLWLTPRTPRSVYRQAYLWAYPFFFLVCLFSTFVFLNSVLTCTMLLIVELCALSEEKETLLHFVYPAVQTTNAVCRPTICNLQQSGKVQRGMKCTNNCPQ